MENLGQHILINESILKECVKQADLSTNDKVLEIGAGPGNLTKLLKCKKIYAVEIDSKYSENLANLENAEIIIEDGLEVAKNLAYNKIVSNLPFHICEPLFHIIIRKEPEKCVFITGNNFFKLLTEETRIGLGIRSLYKIEKILDIDKSRFNPQPRTNSVLFTLTKKKNLTEKDRIIKEIVQQQDKTVKNAFLYAMKRVNGSTNKEAKKLVDKIPEKLLSKRVMHLSNKQFQEIIK